MSTQDRDASIEVVDSHTEGEPTRIVIAGAPDLGPGTAAERAAIFSSEFDGFRRTVVNEPRGFDAMVGGVLCPPNSPDAVAQVIFFNNVGTLNMCVHGTIGLAATLFHLDRIGRGRHRIETPVGDVFATIEDDDSVSVENVTSYRSLRDVRVKIPSLGEVCGDVAWGGNWFFLVRDFPEALNLQRIDRLRSLALEIQDALAEAKIETGDGRLIDHIELFGPPTRADADSRNLVLCPGGEYDRSPCGTGTSAKLACLAADGVLAPGDVWRQESIIGSLFEGRYRQEGEGRIVPTIRGRAWITAQSRLIRQATDPYREGIAAQQRAHDAASKESATDAEGSST